MSVKNSIKLIISLAVPLLIGFLSSFFTIEAIDTWYITLEKPFFNPPNWIFGPVWTILYILMGVSFFLVWKNDDEIFQKKIFFLYATQLFLNFMWSFLFFGIKSPLLAFINITFLWGFIVWNAIEFKKYETTASFLFYPYLLWVSFASVLNISIVVLNRGGNSIFL